ncbi:hypothetical protein [Endozoicomonas sp. GU-1]|uniref:hypothetical protein n=1 Tax=Endozoicomonas sp. GU-1 TaxID=3009078 RepID=UPI0022B38C7E|nr:hypothetical protein [Endozoicomonas sp. GU-1]WBA80943.1 hypothetical protein O2T12_21985 [Endozoicomonas sp. GU-1]WBA88511.1 hypothetical protein O3276_11190 [Endozoicomonas sp. GU-1]
MDAVINQTELVDLSGQTPVHKSTQTNADAASSGSLGPYEVSRIEEVVTFTGSLPENKISLKKGRIVVKIQPALNFTSLDDEDNRKSFSIRFQSLPTNQSSVNGAEDIGGGNFTSDTSISDRSFCGSGSIGTTSSLDRRSSADRKSHYSLTSDSMSRDSTTNSLLKSDQKTYRFTNGQVIREIAKKIRRPCSSSVSEVIINKFITYDPDKAPDWYKNKYEFNPSLRTYIEIFMLKNFAFWMAWVDADGHRKNLFSGSGIQLSPKFVLWIENNMSAFERICESGDMLINIERHIDQCLRGTVKKSISRVEIYESLSFKKIDKASINSINQKGNSPLPQDCHHGIIFYFRNLVSRLMNMIKTEKYTSGKREIHRKIADYTIMQKDKGNFDLLKACTNYNVAVRLLAKEFESSGLAEYDSKKRIDGELCPEVNYSLVDPGHLDVIEQLIFLIETIEKEGRGIISEYKKSIDALPRAIEGNTFEERTLHMFDSGNGYVSRPLNSIKSTLNKILANHPDNPAELPD